MQTDHLANLIGEVCRSLAFPCRNDPKKYSAGSARRRTSAGSARRRTSWAQQLLSRCYRGRRTAPIAPPVVLKLGLEVLPPNPVVLPVELLLSPAFPDGSPLAEAPPEPSAPPFEGLLFEPEVLPLDCPSSLGAPPSSEPMDTN